nr:sugar transferase [Mongoliimonas terrestris]
MIWQPQGEKRARSSRPIGSTGTSARRSPAQHHPVRAAEPVSTIVGTARPWQHGLKRAMDFSLALAALIALSPLLLTIALIIKTTSRGPVFFKQYRVGLGNSQFEIYKFRSMFTERCDLTGVSQTTENDPRVTPIGRFIRKTSIDELPQLLNVLKGDMSLVGPRPHVAGMLAGGVPYEELVANYPMRHAMRPGLTGLAQVNGFRGPTTDATKARLRVEYDLEYIRRFSIALDLRIILRTVWTEFLSGSGY